MIKKSYSKIKNSKILSWASYDWANSSFATTVMAGFFPLFFQKFWSFGNDPTLTTARLGTAISISSLIMAVGSPFMGTLADHKGTKKLFLLIFQILSMISCAALAWVPKGDWFSAATLYAISILGFNAACVFYDSLLPSVAEDSETNFASSLGYSLGYLGGGVLFTFNILMYSFPQFFGLTDSVQAIQFSFISVALWWGIFSIPLFKNIPEPASNNAHLSLWKASLKSLVELNHTVVDLFKRKNLLFFLIAYWLYIDGVYTVITMAVDFGVSIGIKDNHLISALILVQFMGFPFALLFSKFSSWWGAKKPILICIAVYIFITFFASQLQNVWQFYFLAILIGIVQGGVQALSRSLFARMIPPESSGEYFGLFNLVGRFASILGPLIVGFGSHFTNNPRNGMLALSILFIIGGLLLSTVNEPVSANIKEI